MRKNPSHYFAIVFLLTICSCQEISQLPIELPKSHENNLRKASKAEKVFSGKIKDEKWFSLNMGNQKGFVLSIEYDNKITPILRNENESIEKAKNKESVDLSKLSYFLVYKDEKNQSNEEILTIIPEENFIKD